MSQLKRWLTSEGQVGEVPYWYLVLRAARYLRVAPWELAEMPVYWLYLALESEAAEGKAEEWRSKRHSSKL